jgi:feruloyl esterase
VPVERLAAFCRVTVRSHPVANSDIGIELWLPLEGWNGRFLVVGNAGMAGEPNRRAMTAGLARGYAVGSTDTGHPVADNAEFRWALGRLESVRDRFDRAVHELAVQGKAVTDAFYGRAPRWSYFIGSSTGGGQGLKAAQAYPADFDGIVVGAPFLQVVGSLVSGDARVPEALRRGAAVLDTVKRSLLARTVLAACDRQDNIVDGVIGDPMRCAFDVGSLQCPPATERMDCLTPAELAMARAMYAPLRHARTGQVFFPGFPPGSEAGWTFNREAPPYLARVVGQVRDWGHPFDFDADLDTVFARGAALGVDAANPDLQPFLSRGGKLVHVHGWSDPTTPGGVSTEYHARVLAAVGERAVSRGYRLFMVPGMEHSRGGPGVSEFDGLNVIERWVERGEAPDRIEARRVEDGRVVRTRPLCPWPERAVWDARGSPDSSSSFSCVRPRAQ